MAGGGETVRWYLEGGALGITQGTTPDYATSMLVQKQTHQIRYQQFVYLEGPFAHLPMCCKTFLDVPRVGRRAFLFSLGTSRKYVRYLC